MVILYYAQSFYQKSVERKSPKEMFFRFVGNVKACVLNRGLTFNKPIQYLLDYCDVVNNLTEIGRESIFYTTSRATNHKSSIKG